MSILSLLKRVLRSAGATPTITGGSESFGPPVGVPTEAQRVKKAPANRIVAAAGEARRANMLRVLRFMSVGIYRSPSPPSGVSPPSGASGVSGT